MQHIESQLERFFQQMGDKLEHPDAYAYKYVVHTDPTVNSFDIDLHYVNSEGQELEGDDFTPIRVIKNGYEDDVSEPDFKEAILDIFKQLNHDGHEHFKQPTYVSFNDDTNMYHIQSLLN